MPRRTRTLLRGGRNTTQQLPGEVLGTQFGRMCQKPRSTPQGNRIRATTKGISSDLAVGTFLTSFDTHRNLQLTARSSGRTLPKELGCRSTFPFTFT